jgi:hypothetical protein
MNTFSKRMMTIATMLFVAIVLVTSGCKPSVAGQTDDWKANQEHIASMTKDMPQFSAALASVKSRCEAAWAEAEKITDEDKTAEAMKAVNDIIDNGFAGKLYKFNSMIEEIGDYRSKLGGKTMSSSLIAKLNDAIDPADEAIDAAYAAIDKGAASEAEGDMIINPVYTQLKASVDRWKSLKDSYDKEQRDRKKKKK